MRMPWQSGRHTTEGAEVEALQAEKDDEYEMVYYRTEVVEKTYLMSFIDQMVIMLKRNYTLQLRYVRSTLAQTIFAPILFMLLLFFLQAADYANQNISIPNPVQSDLGGVLQCKGFDGRDPCINIMYSPAIEPYNSILTSFAAKNAIRSGETALAFSPAITDLKFIPKESQGLVPVPNAAFIYAYTLQNPNITQWGITFNQTVSPLNIKYQIWYNSSQTTNITDVFGRQLLSMMRGLDEAILAHLNQSPTDLKVGLKDWPVIPPSTLSDTIVQALGPTFFFCSTMIIFIITLNQIVTEKEHKLRHGMEVMGLKPFVYWLSQYLSIACLVVVSTFITIIFGLILGFSAFRNTSFGVLFFTFLLFGLAMVMFAFFITTFVRNSNVAVLIGIFIFIIGLLFESFVFGQAFLGYIWWDIDTPSALWKFFILIPFFNFGKLFLDITTLTTGYLDRITSTFIPGPGFSWSRLYQQLDESLKPSYAAGKPTLPPPVDSLYYLLMNIVLYGVLTWYFDKVIPNEFGYALPWYFLLTPSYWKSSSSAHTIDEQKTWLKSVKQLSSAAVDEDEDSDVLLEREKAKSDDTIEAIKIVNLRKEYKSGLIFKKVDKVAVKNLCITFEEGKLLALLGQNGAGKSTTMNILSGLTPASKGDANIMGHSIKTEMYQIRKIMGICPQHDILFNDLTSREHIELYAGLKGVPREQWPRLIETRLKAVRLWNVVDKRAGTYSGGMKRRLSVVISTIGDPKIVFMDEPTTGMDPVNRRHVWSFIEKFKKDRVIVLTTHSMEEADVLGDRIAIMAHGRLRAIGNSISLKAKYGSGYQISVVCDQANIDVVTKGIQEKVPSAKLEDSSAGAIIYQFPAESTPLIPEFVKYLEENPDGYFKAWGISQTTLEEVFLKIIRAANPKGYSGLFFRAAMLSNLGNET